MEAEVLFWGKWLKHELKDRSSPNYLYLYPYKLTFAPSGQYAMLLDKHSQLTHTHPKRRHSARFRHLRR